MDNELLVMITCGGKGTRIKKALPPGQPKFLADIDGHPFGKLLIEKIDRDLGTPATMLCIKHLPDPIIEFAHQLETERRHGLLLYRRDPYPPEGLWASIKSHMELSRYRSYMIVNGDTYQTVNFNAVLRDHWHSASAITYVTGWGWGENGRGRNFQSPAFAGIAVVERAILPALCRRRDEWSRMSIDEELFEFLDQKLHMGSSMNIFFTANSFYDIGTPEGLERFKRYRREAMPHDHSEGAV